MKAINKTPRTHSPFRTRSDHRGRAIVEVEATKGRTFLLYAKDWRTIRRDYGATWCVTGNGHGKEYIGTRRPGTDAPLILARAIMGAGKGEVVKYLDRNPMNLRRDNLKVVGGAARHQAWPREDRSAA